MQILADENLSAIPELFSEHTVQLKAGRTISRADVAQADVLLVRSVTRVDAALVQGTPVRFVGSATIGTDHLAQDELAQLGITAAYAPGCNAQAVVEYVLSAILATRPEWGQASPRLGIVGLGNIGARLAVGAQQLGWQVKSFDPWVKCEGIKQLDDFNELLSESDVVSLHVPLVKSGPFPTYHLINENTLACMRPQTMLVNASRGAVIEEQALLADLVKTQRQVILDVFEHEPAISAALLEQLVWATPHIAGYSALGKLRGSLMIWQAFQQWLGQSASPIPNQVDISAMTVQQGSWLGYLQQHDWLRRDDQQLRNCLTHGHVAAPCFDRLRKQYPLRQEWHETLALPAIINAKH